MSKRKFGKKFENILGYFQYYFSCKNFIFLVLKHTVRSRLPSQNDSTDDAQISIKSMSRLLKGCAEILVRSELVSGRNRVNKTVRICFDSSTTNIVENMQFSGKYLSYIGKSVANIFLNRQIKCVGKSFDSIYLKMFRTSRIKQLDYSKVYILTSTRLVSNSRIQEDNLSETLFSLAINSVIDFIEHSKSHQYTHDLHPSGNPNRVVESINKVIEDVNSINESING